MGQPVEVRVFSTAPPYAFGLRVAGHAVQHKDRANPMPTVLRWRGYRFYFFSNEGYEPPHIHVDRGGNSVKYWLGPVRLARNFGFGPVELTVIERKVRQEETVFLERWNEHFGSNT